ncbi:MAG: hypothetical protein LBO66_05915 [Deltaproteobacteria bacterium]|jgi:hypothetical protein|nr:hypothetical protein [Deltaproteobacteria bacterium]
MEKDKNAAHKGILPDLAVLGESLIVKQIDFVNSQAALAIKEGQPIFDLLTTSRERAEKYERDVAEKYAANGAPYWPVPVQSEIALKGANGPGELALACLRRWWNEKIFYVGEKLKYIILTFRGEGEGGYLSDEWAYELRELAEKAAVPVKVCALPNVDVCWDATRPIVAFSVVGDPGRVTKLGVVVGRESVVRHAKNPRADAKFLAAPRDGREFRKRDYRILYAKRNPSYNFILLNSGAARTRRRG